MNGDEELVPIVEAWLKQTSASPYGPRVGVGRVMSRVRRTSQRRGLTSILRTAGSPLVIDDPQHRTGPASARAAGHIPNTRRTTRMFTLARALTSAALVFTLGSALIIGRPFEYLGLGAPEATSDVAATQPTWVTGRLHLASNCYDPVRETTEAVVHERGYRCAPQTWTVDDPRLSGQVTSLWDADVYAVGVDGVSVVAGTYVVRNDVGSWTCHHAGVMTGTGRYAVPDLGETLTCTGSGGHEGLTAVLELDWSDFRAVTIQGLIFSGEMVPFPEPGADDEG